MHNISDLLTVQSAGGNDLPYHGYIEFDVSLPVTDTFIFEIFVPVLIVPDTEYNSRVPFLVGTNVLNHVSKCSGDISPLFKVAVNSITLGSRHLEKADGVYGQVLAEKEFEIKPFTGVIVSGQATVVVPICHN